MASIKTYGDQARSYIKQCLLDGTLMPGSPIRETEIARELGISRGPVREALQQLQQEGLVIGEPQRARFIRSMDGQEIIDSYCLGGTLEGACIVQSLPFIDSELLGLMDVILEKMQKQCAMSNGLAALCPIDEEFHDTLLSRCPNRLMVRTARMACTHISKFLYFREWNTLFSTKEFHERHVFISNAVKSRDPESIRSIMLAHYSESGRRLAAVCAANKS